MEEFSISTVWAAAATAISSLFAAFMWSQRGRINDLKAQLAREARRGDALQQELEECHDQHPHNK